MLDNTVRHGKTATEIRISAREEEESGLVIFEDNGVGIPAADKERIFDRGFGKYTGWGLFFAREMLALTGITIAETGVPGTGARFEIRVPREAYRKQGKPGAA
jgi:signal transduction histidine kinase